jgi:hypothetical protein
MAMSTYPKFSHRFIKKVILILLVLDPSEKLSYFIKHWSSQLRDDVEDCAEEVVSAVQALAPFIS